MSCRYAFFNLKIYWFKENDVGFNLYDESGGFVIFSNSLYTSQHIIQTCSVNKIINKNHSLFQIRKGYIVKNKENLHDLFHTCRNNCRELIMC